MNSALIDRAMAHRRSRRLAAMLLWLGLSQGSALADGWRDASPREADDAQGPYKKLIIDGGMLVDGTGAPAYGPVSVVIEGNRIVQVEDALPVDETSPQDPNVRRIDARGCYILPGLIDTHVRLLDHGRDAMSPDYALKLLLAHGVTTIASMQRIDHLEWALKLSKQSERNAITAPRIQPWTDFDAATPEEGRAIVRRVHAMGARGVGEGHISGPPEAAKAIFDEANKLGMRASWHMEPMQAQHMNALDAARAGMHGMAHWYGLPEALFQDRELQHFPADFNFWDIRARFRQAGRLWQQTAPRGSEHYERVLNEFVALDFTIEPTFSVYEANRDYMGTRNADWNVDYLHPVLVKEFSPDPQGRFAQFYDWSSTDEAEWKRNYRRWMDFVNDYKNRGGRVVAGSDAGFMWTNFGFGLVRNLELLEEAGFTTLEALSAATSKAAEHLQLAGTAGVVQPGRPADLVIVPGNPLANLKLLYGTGIDSQSADGKMIRTTGVRYTIKDGIVFDAQNLLADVRAMVRAARADEARASN